MELKTSQCVDFLEHHHHEYIANLSEIVSIDCPTDDAPGVNRIGEWFYEQLTSWGWATDKIPGANVGDCLISRLRGMGTSRLLLVGHMDTVYPIGTAATRPMTFKGGQIVGAGVADMKTGLLTAIWAARALQVVGYQSFGEIALLFTSDEEDGSPIGAEVIKQYARGFDAAFVLEAARPNGLVTARKGGGRYVLTIQGREAHAGVEPEKGINAIVELAHHVLELSRLHNVETGTSVNVGVVEGGTKFNVVPNFARAFIDVRAVTDEDLAEIDKVIRASTQNVRVAGAVVSISGQLRPAMPLCKGNSFLFELAQQVGRQLNMEIDQVPVTGGTSDANFLAAMGIPVLDGLGPIGGNDHSPDEYVLAESIIPYTALLSLLLVETTSRIQQVRDLTVADSESPFLDWQV